jgi:hypothetical protein
MDHHPTKPAYSLPIITCRNLGFSAESTLDIAFGQ